MHAHLKEDTFLSKLIKLAQKNRDISVMWIYGSQVDQSGTDTSDYDIGIAFHDFMKDPLTRRLRPEKLALGWTQSLNCNEDKISIVDINVIPTTLAWEIVTQGIAIYIRDKDRLVREELRIFRQFELDVSYHRRIYGEKN